MTKDRKFSGRLVALAGVCILAAATGSRPTVAGADRNADEAELVALSSRWVEAVAGQSPELVRHLGAGAARYYGHLRDLALHGDVNDVGELDPMDQLQVFFLRLTVDPDRLEEMSDNEILLHAIGERWIGQDLRRSDELREIVVDGNTATGRLYKFGKSDRPDRGRQYFVREEGEWRVDLRGERERLQMDFDAFVARSGLAASEAAFFILETRLLRKVTPADFVPPRSDGSGAIPPPGVARPGAAEASRRLVAVRESPDDPSLAAVTLADPVRSLRYVVGVGDRVGDGSGDRLIRLSGDQAWLERDAQKVVLRLDPMGLPLDHRSSPSARREDAFSLLDQARLGQHREGMMSQWRNVGLRGRPQLLQQARLVPEFGAEPEAIQGLRVRSVVAGSFWDQIGLTEGDLLVEVNAERLDSMDRWKKLLRIAETEQAISVVVRRKDRRLRFHVRTVPAHGAGEAA